MADRLGEPSSKATNKIVAFRRSRDTGEPASVVHSESSKADPLEPIWARFEKFLLDDREIEELSRSELALRVGELRKVAEQLRAVCVEESPERTGRRIEAIAQQVMNEQAQHERRLQDILDDQLSGILEGDIPALLEEALNQREAARARHQKRLLINARKKRFWVATCAMTPMVVAYLAISRAQEIGPLSQPLLAFGMFALVWCAVVAQMMPSLPRGAAK